MARGRTSSTMMMGLTISYGKRWDGEDNDDEEEPKDGVVNGGEEIGASLCDTWQREEEAEATQCCSHQLTPPEDDLKAVAQSKHTDDENDPKASK